ncbi:MAG: hypothetical protein GY724_12870 [Actinomycetia bacterium]|nr:hypothetical protein [Actinomycetes bacterium]MCP4226139.1 hypothetical protein [Actinomycetes bacterium]MCP5035382.1 hypothetical protein [Actinomycetes bacterium]
MIAALGDTPYDIVLMLHILAVMAAFAPAFTHPILFNQSKTLEAQGRRTMLGFMTANGQRIYAPALIVAGLLGFVLSGMSEKIYEMSQGWLIGSMVVWIAMNGVLHAVILPGEKAVIAGDEGAQRRIDAGGATITVLLLVMLYLMVFKPGF